MNVIESSVDLCCRFTVHDANKSKLKLDEKDFRKFMRQFSPFFADKNKKARTLKATINIFTKPAMALTLRKRATKRTKAPKMRHQ